MTSPRIDVSVPAGLVPPPTASIRRAEPAAAASPETWPQRRSAAGCAPALVLDGGGARAAYQVGVLRAIARHFPGADFPVLVGASAGAINIAILANRRGTLLERVEELARQWAALDDSCIFRTSGLARLRWMAQTTGHLLLGLQARPGLVRGLLDTSAMRSFLERATDSGDGSLPGIEDNLRTGRLRAVAVTATSYASGEAITFWAGRPGVTWDRPQRRAVQAQLRIDHVMASSALPFVYPAVAVDGSWYGDGEIALRRPLAPALHLGADRILVISTRSNAERAGAERPPPAPSHPAPGEVMSALYDAVFADPLDPDCKHLRRVNELVAGVPPGGRNGLRHVQLLVLRPSQDLGALACDPDIEIPASLRFLSRRLDLRRAGARNFLSVVMLQRSFIERVIAIGERDGERQADRVAELLLA